MVTHSKESWEDPDILVSRPIGRRLRTEKHAGQMQLPQVGHLSLCVAFCRLLFFNCINWTENVLMQRRNLSHLKLPLKAAAQTCSHLCWCMRQQTGPGQIWMIFQANTNKSKPRSQFVRLATVLWGCTVHSCRAANITLARSLTAWTQAQPQFCHLFVHSFRVLYACTEILHA